MLQPAKNYEEALKQKLRDTWYDPDYIFYYSDSFRYDINLDDDNIWSFVSIDRDDNLVGFVSFRIDRDANQARSFGAISFDIGNTTFSRDVIQLVDDIFMKYKFNRLDWFCIEGAPALSSYLRYCIRHGGELVGREHDCVKTIDGELRGSFTFEILANKYVPLSKSRR